MEIKSQQPQPDTIAPQISAIICTHNRDQYLGAAIDTLLAQDCPQHGIDYEILVVDNGSTDTTQAIVEQRLHHSRLRYLWEPILGLSTARNTGANAAQAEILAYLDDDAEATPQWLRVLYQAYQEREKLAIAGGRVTLIWPEGITPPHWLSDNLAGNLGAYDLGDRPIEITQPGLTPRGLNYSLRRSFLKTISGFDPNLGRVGKNLLSNEELLMTEKALEAGWHVMYLPEALVAHNVSPERTVRSWFVQRGWWQGISECYREQLAGRAGWAQIGRGLERMVRGLYNSLRYWRDPARRFDSWVYAYAQLGYLRSAIIALLFPNL